MVAGIFRGTNASSPLSFSRVPPRQNREPSPRSEMLMALTFFLMRMPFLRLQPPRILRKQHGLPFRRPFFFFVECWLLLLPDFSFGFSFTEFPSLGSSNTARIVLRSHPGVFPLRLARAFRTASHPPQTTFLFFSVPAFFPENLCYDSLFPP